jgi:hypothetical protein
MGHIASIGAGLFSDLCVSTAALDAVKSAITANTGVEAAFKDLFATADIDTTAFRIANVREFPSMGTPPNIVNVPVYGSKTSQQIQGQSDAPSMEITLNFVASDWAADTDLGDLVADGKQHAFRFTMLNSEPPGYGSDSTNDGLGGSTAGGTETENSQYFWIGKIEALQVNPQLTDANTATVTISVQSQFYGAYTTDPAA